MDKKEIMGYFEYKTRNIKRFIVFKSLTLRQKYGIKLWFNTVFFYILSRFQN